MIKTKSVTCVLFYSDLEETLLLLPYSAACEILKMLPKLLQSDYHTELIARLALCLVKAHHGPIIANQELLPTLETVKTLAIKKVSELRVGTVLLYEMYLRTYPRNLE